MRAANTEARTAAGQAGAAHSFFSSSISMSFCLPVDGLAMLSCAHSRQHTFERSCGQSGLVWRGDGRTFILAKLKARRSGATRWGEERAANDRSRDSCFLAWCRRFLDLGRQSSFSYHAGSGLARSQSSPRARGRVRESVTVSPARLSGAVLSY